MGNDIIDNLEQNQSSGKKAAKPVNKAAKFIWFAISVVMLAAGIIMAKAGVSFENYIIKGIFAAAVMVPLFITAQKISCERIREDGTRNILAFIFYYLCIILLVALIPFILWINIFIAH